MTRSTPNDSLLRGACRIALLGNVHGNLSALEAVLQDARKHGAEALIALGNLVGWGARPVECLELLDGAQLSAGAAELVVSGHWRIEAMSSPIARASFAWTAAQLGQAGRLGSLSLLPPSLKIGGLVLLNSTAFNWTTLSELSAPPGVLEPFREFGLTISPSPDCCLFVNGAHVRDAVPGDTFSLENEGEWHVIGIGSVGLAGRRLSRHADYALLHLDRRLLSFHRCGYPVEREISATAASSMPSEVAALLTR